MDGLITINEQELDKILEILQEKKPDGIILDYQTALKAFNKRETICSKTRNGLKVLNVKDIYYFQAEHKYVTAFLKSEQYLIDEPMQQLERDLTGRFVRVHRKSLIAIDKVSSLDKDDNNKTTVTIKDLNIKIQVSRRQLPQVRQYLLCK